MRRCRRRRCRRRGRPKRSARCPNRRRSGGRVRCSPWRRARMRDCRRMRPRRKRRRTVHLSATRPRCCRSPGRGHRTSPLPACSRPRPRPRLPWPHGRRERRCRRRCTRRQASRGAGRGSYALGLSREGRLQVSRVGSPPPCASRIWFPRGGRAAGRKRRLPYWQRRVCRVYGVGDSFDRPLTARRSSCGAAAPLKESLPAVGLSA